MPRSTYVPSSQTLALAAKYREIMRVDKILQAKPQPLRQATQAERQFAGRKKRIAERAEKRVAKNRLQLELARREKQLRARGEKHEAKETRLNIQRMNIQIEVDGILSRIRLAERCFLEEGERLYRTDPLHPTYAPMRLRVQRAEDMLERARQDLQTHTLKRQLQPKAKLSVKQQAQQFFARRDALDILRQTDPAAAKRLMDANKKKYEREMGQDVRASNRE